MQVVILGIEPEYVLAHVAGIEDYRTELWGTANSRIDSSVEQRLLQTDGRGDARGQCHRQ